MTVILKKIDRVPENTYYIETNAVITKNVSIAGRCVIRAGAVVTKAVPDHSIVAGVPARIVGRVIIDDIGGVSFEYFSN